jgi:hypothetical protein
MAPTLTQKKQKPSPQADRRLVLMVLMGEFLLYTWCRVQCVNTGYAIAGETRKQQELKMLQNNLKIELARLKAPENLYPASPVKSWRWACRKHTKSYWCHR